MMKNILLVEDDEDDAIFFIDVVKEINNSLNVHQAKNGREALEKLHEMVILPDLIFMDINMPVMDGFECLKQLKSQIHLKQIPVVILTSFNKNSEPKFSKAFGASFFLSKPTTLLLLKKKIRNMLNLNFLHVVSQRSSILNTPFLKQDTEPHIMSLIKGGLS
jgi:CheY-like chemotaxis protein